MDDERRVNELVEQALESGRTPEELCSDCPELLERVRADCVNLRRLQSEIEELFPSTTSAGDAAPTPPPFAGEFPRIEGYEFQAVLGRGGMGIVYKAYQQRLRRSVALKMLLHGAYASRDEQLRFHREAEAIGGVHHSNIVQVYDAGEVQGLPYFTMELIEGGNLAQMLAGAPQPALYAAELVAALAVAIGAAHSSGIIHRDLKPANVLLAPDGTPKITDFGLARRFEGDVALTRSGARVGTPSYMAPEQAAGKTHAIGPSTDVYALGAILYEAITGRPPFLGETAIETEQQVIHGDPVAPARLNPRVPRDLETICLKCLQKDPARRYPTAAALAEDLHRFRRGEPVSARRVGAIEQAARWVRRRPAVAGLLAAVTLILATAAFGVWSAVQRNAAARSRQARTDQDVRDVLKRARDSLDEGWKSASIFLLRDAVAQAVRAVDVAHSGGASAAVELDAETLQRDAAERLDRVQRDDELTATLLGIYSPPEIARDDRGRSDGFFAIVTMGSGQQFSEAFRKRGFDLDRTPEAEIVEQLRREPPVVVNELLDGLDGWMLARRQEQRPEEEWRRIAAVADRLDESERRRRLRVFLVDTSPASEERKAELLKLSKEIDPATEPVLTIVLVARACDAIGDEARAGEVLHRAALSRPDQVVLLDALGRQLVQQKPPRLEEAIGYFRAARALRPRMGMTLSRVLALAGRPEEGKEVVRELAAQFPDDPQLWAQLGMLAVDQQKYEEALAAFTRVLALAPNAAAHFNFALALVRLGRPEEAETHVREALRTDPELADARILLGMALNLQSKFVEAEAICRPVVETQPASPDPYEMLGIAMMEQGKFVEAEAHFRKAVSLDPRDAFARNNLGHVLRRSGRFREAEAAYRETLELPPGPLGTHMYLGEVLVELKRFAEAEAFLRKAVELDPKDWKSFNNLGVVLNKLGRPGEAEDAYRKVIELNPEFTRAYNDLGVSLYKQGRLDEAEAAYRKAIELDPHLHGVYHNLGHVLLEQGRFGEAEATFKRQTGIQPDDWTAYCDHGVALQLMVREVEAEASFRRATELAPDEPTAFNGLGAALIDQGRYAEAQAAFEKALAHEPGFILARLNLGRALLHLARFHEAAEAFERVVASISSASALRDEARRSQEECLRLEKIEARLSAILDESRGSQDLSSADDPIDVARLCMWKGLHVAAARLYEDAFDADRGLTADPRADHRHDAARCAVRAAADEANDLVDAERTRLRDEAAGWLTDDLEARLLAIATNVAQRPEQLRTLRLWLVEPDLASVRDSPSLAQLPDEERPRWKKFWEQVDAAANPDRSGK